jgi:hypothetical protein
MRMMSVEFGFETAVLEGTDLAISSPFTMEVLREDGLRVRATAHVVDGRRLVCRALELSTEDGEIDRELLHGLGLATMLRQAANGAAWRVGKPTSNERRSGELRFDTGVIRSDLQRHIKGIPLIGPRKLTDEFLTQVAVVYRQAVKDRKKTWSAVAELQESWFGVPGSAYENTARRWIAAARKRRFLKKTVQGRKGG